MSQPFGSPAPRSPAAIAGLRVSGLSKTFPGTRALSDVTITVKQGEIHSLMGGNGSGKSTLIKILAGVERGDPQGLIAVGEREISPDRIGPLWAAQAGLRFVHQDLGLFDELTVVENLFAGQRPPRRFGHIDWRRAREHAQSELDRRGIDIRAGQTVGGLRASERTLVAIVRALRDPDGAEHRLLVLDEPTARLPADEITGLLDAIARYREQGGTVVYVSHRLEEVRLLGGSVTILRDGRVVATRPAESLDESGLVEMMVGAPPVRHATRPPHAPGPPLLQLRGVDSGPLRDVNLTVGRGEVVGVCGLVGSGRTHLLQTVFGARARTAGTIEFEGETLRADIGMAIARGIAFVPEDRLREGVFPGLSVGENISASGPRRHRRGVVYRNSSERAEATRAIAQFNIRARGPAAALTTLSGGNQQKVLLARWLLARPRLLLLDEPTQAVDVAARADIHRHIDAVVAAGSSVLLVSSDLDELIRLVDRVLILAGGRIVDDSAGAKIDRRWLAGHMHRSTATERAA